MMKMERPGWPARTAVATGWMLLLIGCKHPARSPQPEAPRAAGLIALSRCAPTVLPDGAVTGTPAALQTSTDARVSSFLNPDLDAAALHEAGRVEALPGQRAGATAW